MKSKNLTRRQFLQRSSVCAAAAGTASVLDPVTAQAAVKRISANEQIHLGFVGVGGMGRSHFNRLIDRSDVHVVAACDADRKRQKDAQDYAAAKGQDVTTYVDFREMLDRHPSIDAVFVATPDHWHALAAIACMQAGKDVYCEKPLALTLGEGRKMVEAARRYDRVCQMGTMQRSDQPQFRHACELVTNGRIGTLEKVVCFFGANPHADYVQDEEPPDYLDWDFYLGPAPWRPFNRLIHPYNFRYFRDYSGGLLTDWGVHLFDIAQWGMGKDYTSAKRVEAETKMYKDNMYEFPKYCRIQYDYGDMVLEWQQGTGEDVEPGQGYGTKFYGSEGEICVNRSGYWARRKDGKPLDERIGPNDTRLYASSSHHDDFFNCMHTREKPICDVEIGHRATAISHLGNIATRLGRPIDYDPDREHFPGDPAANKMIAKPMRAPWHL